MGRIYGLDLGGQKVSQSTWKKFLDEKHIGFAIVRCFRNRDPGIIDDACEDAIAAAVAAGVTEIGVYHFPVINAKTPEDQANVSMDFLTSKAIDYTTLFLDVEGGNTPWHQDSARNVDFIQRFIDTVIAAGGRPGIYTGTDTWNKITGHSSQFSSCPLWWSGHGKAYKEFGGWSATTYVQYAYDQEWHGVKYDSDFREA